MDAVAALFATEDRQLTRSTADVYHAFDLKQQLGITHTSTGIFCAAINFLLTDVTRTMIDRKAAPQEIIDFAHKLIRRYHDFIEATTGSSTENTGKVRASVVALALATMGTPHGYNFWNGFAFDDGLRRTDPRKVYLEFCRTTSLTSGGAFSNGRKLTSPLRTFKTGAYCWNRYVQQQEIKALQLDKVDDVDSIKETPFATGFTAENFFKLLES